MSIKQIKMCIGRRSNPDGDEKNMDDVKTLYELSTKAYHGDYHAEQDLIKLLKTIVDEKRDVITIVESLRLITNG